MNDGLQYLDKLQGLPALALVFLSCIVMGYVWRLIRLKWFSNDAIPLFVILWGAIANAVMADPRAANMPARIWLMRNVLIGAIVGFLAWMLHNYALSKLESALVTKFPNLGDTAFFSKPAISSQTPQQQTADTSNKS